MPDPKENSNTAMLLKPRRKSISLRMTEEEYEAVQSASASGSARCVSDFARSALLLSAQSARPAAAFGCALLSDIDTRLTRVEIVLSKVAEQLDLSRDTDPAGEQPTE